jgi:hypothetical protein
MSVNILSRPSVLTVKEFLARYRMSRTKLYQLLATGQLTARKLGTRTLIEIDEAERWASTLPSYRSPKRN